MKIILTVHQFLPDFSAGTEVITLGIARELMLRGHQVLVVTGFPVQAPSAAKEAESDRYSYQGVCVQRFPHAYQATPEQPNIAEMEYNNRLFYRFFCRLLRQEKPDLVHFIHLGRLSASAIDACQKIGIPTIYTVTDFWLVCPFSQLRLWDNSLCSGPQPMSLNCVRHHLHRLEQRTGNEFVTAANTSRSRLRLKLAATSCARRVPEWMLRALVRAIHKTRLPLPLLLRNVRALSERPDFMRARMNKVDVVLAPSQIVRSMLTRNGLEPERVCILSYGIELGQIQRSTRRGKQPILRVGFVGAVSEHKGCHVLIQAIRDLPQETAVELKVFGSFASGPEGEAYRRRLLALAGADARIHMVGSFDNTQIGAVLSGLDVLVVPSIWYENTPVVIYEALAAGCPVVATDLDGMSEVVHHEVNGLLFSKGDAEDLARSLRRLADDRALLKRLAANTRTPQSVAEHVAKLEEVYQQVLERKKPRH